MLRFFALTGLVFLATGSAAEDDGHAAPEAAVLFEVEILVFTNTTLAPLPAEQTDQAAMGNSVGPPDAPSDSQVTALRPEALRLGNLRAKLDRLPDHEVLLHSGWIQALQDERTAHGVPLAQARASRGLSGTITTYRGRFLHIALDLTLPTADGSTATARLRQSRRVKAGALHYFDNPSFGAIVVVRPAAAPAPT